MASGARFKINTSLSADAGYDTSESTTLDLQLEASPALDVNTCRYSLLIASDGAPTPTFTNGGVASPATSVVQVTLGAGSHSYAIQCQTNGGVAVKDANGKDDRTVNTFVRIVSVRNTAGLRKIIVAEQYQYDPVFGWTNVINELVDAVNSSGADLTALEARVTAAEADIAALSGLVAWTQTPLKTENYTAVAWQHVLVDMDGAGGDVTITLPASSLVTKDARVRISDVASDGGLGRGAALKVAATFASTTGGHFAASPYVIADNGAGLSRQGANIELLDTGAGWLVVQEGCRPASATS